MTKIVVHTDDLPAWAVRKQKLPPTYLGFLREATFPSPDGKGMESLEDKMLRQHWDEMVNGNVKARDWLLRKVIEENKKVLAAAPERPDVVINGILNYQPLGPVLELLGCIAVHNPNEGDSGPPTVALAAWFVDELHQRCRPDKLAPVLAWQERGGQQNPRINRDLEDD